MQNDNEIMVNILKKINQNKIYITQIRNKFSSLEIGLIRKLYDDESIINVFTTPITIAMYNYFCKKPKIDEIKTFKNISLMWGTLVIALA